MSPLAAEAQRVHRSAGLSGRQIAAATGARPSTVRDWLSGRSGPSGLRADRLVELAEMTDRLARVMKADYIPVWLSRPLVALDDEKPVDVLARGDYRRVAKLIAELEYPGVS
jgi:transcriptional regulator with XRE-family HTH domain